MLGTCGICCFGIVRFVEFVENFESVFGNNNNKSIWDLNLRLIASLGEIENSE